MSVADPPDLAEFVQEEARQGHFDSEGELFVAALTMFREMRQRHGELKDTISKAIAEANGGKATALDIDYVNSRDL